MRGAHEVRAERHEKSAAHVVAERHGPEQLGAGAPFALGHRERGGYDGAAGMRLGHRLEIVRFVGVAEHAVGQCGVDCRRPDVGRQNRGFTNAALSSYEPNRQLTGFETGSRDHRCERVEDSMLAVARDL
ncbi:MAG TPA: hypothetical protein VGQ10_05115, partial [Vicinamibacterales bacterium]|nr:hypothetical protein [Vicinamibacterales bacterium]